MLVVNEMYLYNFICKNTKTNTDTYRCQNYKSSFHCNAYIKKKIMKLLPLLITTIMNLTILM